MTLQEIGYSKALEIVSSCQVLHSCADFLPDHAHRTLYESKGLEFNDVSSTFLYAFLVTEKT